MNYWAIQLNKVVLKIANFQFIYFVKYESNDIQSVKKSALREIMDSFFRKILSKLNKKENR